MNAISPLASQYSYVNCTIHLHGRLAELYGPEMTVPGSTVSAAIRNMLHRKPQMLNVFEQGEYHIIRGDEKGGIDLDASMLHMRIGPSRQIHILPAARGGGSNGAGLKIVLGAVMIAAAVATGGAALAGYGAAAGVFSSASLFQIAGTLAIMGVSMLLEGISRVIAPQPGLGASYLINGNLNTTQQGTPVPLVYGTARVGSVVIASAYSAEDYNTSTSDYQGQAAFTNASGGYSGTLDAFDTGNPLPSGASGKGSSKSSSGGGIEAPNTLESKAIVYLIDMISEGPIGGIVGGAQGIYFNGTPLQNANGSFNFRGVSWTYLFGTPDQTPPSGYPSAVEDMTVGQQVFYQTPVVNQLVSSTATQARITIELPSLFATNTQNGDVNPSTLGLVIAVAEVTGSSVGAYSVVVNDTIHGKCTAAYQRSYVFDLPGSGTGGTTTTWNVRVSKATPESAVSTTVNTLYWSNTDLISNYQLMYPNSAMVCLKIDSEAFGSTIPTRSYLTSGIELQIPTNYNPVTGIYATSGPGTAGGAWDMASFSSGVSSNPAWILYDFLSNSRYGLGLSAQMLEVAREQLYPIAQYCDGLVPDGGGATERRYQLNGVFSQRTDAFKLMQAIAATFRGQVYWGAGQVCVTADMPTTPVKLYTAANVIDGNFVYNGTSLKTRHTTTNVHFSDPTNQYLPAVEVVELPPQVALRGVYAADILGFGVTSRGLAHRAGNWLLYTENYQTETVAFSVGWDSAAIAPGQVFQVADPAVAGIRMGGRLRSTSTVNVLALDMVFSPVASTAYTVSVILQDGSVAVAIGVTAFGTATATPSGSTYTTVTLAAPLPQVPLNGAVYALQDAATPVTLWQLVGMSEKSRGIFDLVAVAYNPAKYALVEDVPTLEIPAFSNISSSLVAPLSAPSNVSALTTLAGQGLTTLVITTVSWSMPTPPDSRIVQYQVSVVNAEGTTVSVLAVTGTSVTINNLSPDTYYFAVRSLGSNGSTSSWAYSSPHVVTGTSNNTPGSITNLAAVPGSQQVFLTWTGSTQSDVQYYLIWRSDTATAPYQPGTLAAEIGNTGGTMFTDADAYILQPGTEWNYWVQAVTTTGVIGALSAPASCEISYIQGSQIQNLAINTINAFAANFSPVVVWTEAALPANPAAIGGATSLVWSQDFNLYVWNTTTNPPSWTSSVALALATAGGGVVTNANLSTVFGNTTFSAATITSLISTATLPAANVSGLLTAVQSASISAGNIVGKLTNTQITSLTAAQITGGNLANNIYLPATGVTGALTENQIAAVYATAIVAGALPSGVTLDATGVTGALTENQIAAVYATAIVAGALPSNVTATFEQITDQLAPTQITNNQVTAKSIAAGAVTTAALAVGSPNNYIWNSCLTLTSAGWTFGSTGSPTGFVGGALLGSSLQSALMVPGIGGGYLYAPALSSSQTMSATWPQIPVIPGAYYCGQVALATQGATASVLIQWFDSTNTFISQVLGNTTGYQNNTNVLSKYGVSYIIALAPSNAAFANLVITSQTGYGYATIVAFTQALFGQVAGASVVGPLVWTPGGATQINGGMIQSQSISANQIVSQSITTNQIAAGTINAGNIAAGAITTAALAVGSPNNYIWNSCWTLTMSGWNPYTGGSPANFSSGTVLGSAYSASWLLPSFGGAFLYSSAYNSSNQAMELYWPSIPVVAGQYYCAQVSVASTGCKGVVLINWQNAAGAGVGSSAGLPVSGNATGGTSLTQYATSYVVAQAPVGATSAVLVCAAGGGSGVSSLVVFTQALFGQVAGASVTGPLVWTPGGVTQINGGMIQANSISANQIVSQSITTNQIAVGTIQAGNIAAGAITAASLAVGSPNNQIWNSCATLTDAGWSYGSVGTLVNYGHGSCAAAAYAAQWLAPGGSGYLFATTLPANGQMYAVWAGSVTGSNGCPVVAGQYYAAQMLVIGQNCTIQVGIIWYNASGTQLSISSGNSVVPASNVGTLLANYVSSHVVAVAPAGATTGAVVVFGLAGASAQTAAFVGWTQALFGQVAGASVTGPLVWTPGGVTQINGGMIQTQSISANQIVSQSITTNQIAVGTIQASNIAAGAITAASLAVGSPNNQIWNSCATLTDAGWSYGSVGTLVNYGHGSCAATAYAAQWLAPGGSGYLFATTLPANGQMYAVWAGSVTGSNGCPVVAGQYYAAQMLVIGQNCTIQVGIIWYNASGTQLSISSGNSVVPASNVGTLLANYVSSYVVAVAPAGATTGAVVVFGLAGTSAQPNAFVGWTQALFGQVAGASVAGPLVWTPGGVTQINGGMIQTQSITTNQIAVGTIQAGNIAAGAITTAQLSVGSANNQIWNSCLTLSSAGWTFNGPAGVAGGPTLGSSYQASWMPAGGSGYVAATISSSQTINAEWSGGMPVVAGSYYAAQASLNCQGVSAYVVIAWFNLSGTLISTSNGQNVAAGGASSGTSLAQYSTSFVIAQAPVGATTAQLWVQSNPGSGSAAWIFFTQTLFGQVAGASVVGPLVWSPGGVTQISGGQIQTGSVTTTQIAAYTIQANDIAAGAITTASLAVGSPSNQIWNSCLTLTSAGWTFNGPTGTSGGPVNGSGYQSSGWLAPGGSGFLTCPSLPSTNGISTNWTPIGVVAGNYYIAQALIIPQQVSAYVNIVWYNSSGGVISQNNGNVFASGVNNGGSNGSVLANWYLSYVVAQAPVGAATAALVINTGPGNGNQAYLFFTQALFGQVTPSVVGPVVWSAGGVTQINGGQIQTQSITTNQIAAQTIVAGNILNGTLTSTQIQANKITSDSFATGALQASLISSGTLNTGVILAGLENLGTLQVDSAHIANLTVGTINMADGSISAPASTSSSSSPCHLTVSVDNYDSVVFACGEAFILVNTGTNDYFTFSVVISRNGGNVFNQSVNLGGIDAGYTYVVPYSFVDQPNAGSVQYTVTITETGSSGTVYGYAINGIFIQAAVLAK